MNLPFYLSFLGKECFVFVKKTLAFLSPRISCAEDSRIKKSHCFSLEKQVFSSPRMTKRVVDRKAMILAAGLGKRMRPLTDTLPKPLISVAGRTMLARAFEHLHDVEITHIVVNTHYLANLIEQAVSPGTLISREDILLETGGGIKKALPLLGEEAFFTMNGDGVWSDSKSLLEMDKTWDDSQMDALLLLIPREKAHGYIGLGDFFLSSEGILKRPEKGEEAPFVYIGIQLISPRLFDDAPEGSFSLNTLWDKAIARDRLYGFVHKGDYFHISTPEELEKYEPVIRNL